MQLYALTVPTRRSDVDLTQPQHATALWTALRRRYPSALGGLVMPDGVELITLGASAGDAQRELASCLQRVAREGAMQRHAFAPVPRVDRIDGRDALRRRLVKLWSAPVERGLAEAAHEPLWTSFRDAIGASASPWIGAGATARWLAVSRADVRALAWTWTHGRRPTPAPPTPAQARATLSRVPITLGELALAAAAATRADPAAIRHQTPTRRLFVWMGLALGVATPERLAQVCATDLASITRIGRVVEGHALDAGLVCAADPRLTSTIRRRLERRIEPGGAKASARA